MKKINFGQELIMKDFFNSAIATLTKVLIGVLLAIIITFLWRNWMVLNETALKFVGTAEYPLWLWLLLTFMAGGFTWYIAGFKTRWKLNRTLNQKEKEIAVLKNELDKLRTPALADEVKTPGPVLPSQDISAKKN